MLALYTNLSLRLRREEKGATAVEYGIMVALIAVVIIAGVSLFGTTLTNLFGEIACENLQTPAKTWNASTKVCS